MNAPKTRSATTARTPSKLEARFAALWQEQGGCELVEEYRFHPVRKWRADFAHLASRTLIEIEGGTWSGGRHTRGSGFAKDCEKYLEAALAGWLVLRLTGGQVNKATVARIVDLVAARADLAGAVALALL